MELDKLNSQSKTETVKMHIQMIHIMADGMIITESQQFRTLDGFSIEKCKSSV